MKKTFIKAIQSVSLAALMLAAPLSAMGFETTSEEGRPLAAAASKRDLPLIKPRDPEFQRFLEDFRGFIRGQDEAKRFPFSVLRPNSRPFITELVGYVDSLPESEEKSCLRDSLRSHERTGSISPAKLLGCYFKAAHLRGAPSESEKSIFAHAVQELDDDTQSLARSLSDPEGWESNLSAFLAQRFSAAERDSFPFLRHADYGIYPIKLKLLN